MVDQDQDQGRPPFVQSRLYPLVSLPNQFQMRRGLVQSESAHRQARSRWNDLTDFGIRTSTTSLRPRFGCAADRSGIDHELPDHDPSPETDLLFWL